MTTQNKSAWWKHSANMTTELRYSKLRALVKKGDSYGLICRLYDLAASLRQDGEMAQIDDDVLALRLEFKGSGARLRRILTEAGYLNHEGKIVGWEEDIFRLYSSIRDQSRERGLKSAAVAKERLAAAQAAGEKTEHEKIGEKMTASVQRAVERPVAPDAMPPSSNSWPIALTPDQLAEISRDTGKDADLIAEMWPKYRDRKMEYREDYGNGDGIAGFRHVLREAKAPARVALTKEVLVAPPNWRELLDVLYPVNLINPRGDPWSSVPLKIQLEILALANPTSTV